MANSLRTVPAEKNADGKRLKKARKDNKSTGILGVSKTFDRSGRKGRKIPCFSVSWCPEKGRPMTKRFYIHKFESEEAALKAAKAFRKKKETERYGD